MSSETSELARVRKGLIDKAITDGVDLSYPRGSSNFALPLGGGKRSLLVRAENSFTKEGEKSGIPYNFLEHFAILWPRPNLHFLSRLAHWTIRSSYKRNKPLEKQKMCLKV